MAHYYLRGIMAKLLFRLNGVLDEEADDIRNLLDQHNIEFYQTDAGRWLVGLAAIWLKDESQYAEARELIDEYEMERYQRIREEDEYPSFVQGVVNKLWQSPIEFILALIAVAFILGVSIYPFIQFK